ncbi:fibrinogen alpha chain-like [Myxocyprinus asiaticus]|uniref:fibrinogen alpha chain-like n=1 Tax=Myxocyprinus asiaticus TaxID=70543 RepID=UPI0022233FAF|nr:fibrinogen alpha chain-like [Myxocyprinus asiaticus]
MKLTHFLLCLVAFLSSALSGDTIVDPRGGRPIEHGYKAQETCQTKEWPMCTDDEWGSKCPSGCRIQGLMDKADHDILKKIEKIRRLLNEGRQLYTSADHMSKTTYSYLRERLTSDAGNDNRYASLAEQLRQRISEIKIKIDRQLRLLEALKTQVKNQVVVMKRLEVDIDIKLRACKGSCASYSEFTVDRESYVTLDKQMDNLNALTVQSVETVSTLGIMKSRPLKDVVVPSIYKTGPGTGTAEQKRLLFGDVGQMKLSLEAEGSTAESAATVSKFPTGMDSSSPSTSHSSLSKSVSVCTKTTRKVVTHTKDGPVEKVEVIESGSGCESVGNLGISDQDGKSITTLSHGTDDLGGFGDLDFFKGLSTDAQKLSSSSSSSKTFSSSKTTLTDGSKGSKTTISSDPFFGEDPGAFMHGDVEEDIPDIHARSVKLQDERKAGIFGRDCVEILQKHANGGQNDLFKIKPSGSEEVVDTGLGGWALVQQKEDGSCNFNRSWKEYQAGFAQIDKQGKGEVWIGNKFLHLLTTQNDSLLRVELQDWEGKEVYAEYNIKVVSEAEGFVLTVSDYVGDEGDGLGNGHPNLLSFLSHAGMKFSTFDRDNDKWEENCAEMHGGGWWYNNCQSANLNGVYYKGGQYDPGTKVPYEIENGVVWLTFNPADYSLKVVRMKIRPV